MTQLRILISGASIAGPAAALLLARQGHDVTIVERASSLRGGGQTVDLRGAGRTVVERMGLTAATDARLLDQRGIAKVDARGRRGAAIPVEAFGGNGIVSTHEILRGDLAEVLVDALHDEAPDVRYLWDDTVTAIRQRDGGADVEFFSAADDTFDLVIGADGLTSAVRRAAFGPDSETLRPIGLRYAWFTADVDEDLDGWYLMHNALGGRVVSARPSRTGAGVKAGLSIRGSDATRRSREEQYRLFEETFGDLGWITPQLLTAMRKADDWAYNDLAQVRLDGWTRGRVALVGDAGYCPTPLTGLGTTLALVGAYVLAGELGGAAGDVATALQRYDAVMRPFVARTQALPPSGVSGYAPKSRIGLALGELSYRTMNHFPAKQIFASQFEKADGIDLPSYA
ncbi:FAD-dependent monooxygenase [Tsukamurella sp. 8F]|uniref:FAD-dependent monooxygenase n=1 Tax=unclassified Tsukamurella TaxID=2633480 RepID=UPI0023B91E25|nr:MULTISPECIES: FAD-dependent monooxygenase [unclassified Tsukamurella]MDF0530891.1 FAD-dependent monooxygenase [Tsukamurella sp. 8J]MDF0588164.1 FAD-dependent monooxygenase [Tsukamurella sp. 8F]